MRASWLIALALSLASPALPQGFSGLGSTAEGFAEVRPGHHLTFPRDHGPHPAFRIEWWYITANLTDARGGPLGIQWTVFRIATTPRPSGNDWQADQIWMAHAAVTTPDRHLFAERFARGGIGQAGAQVDPVDVWLDDWRMTGPSMEAVTLTARADEFAYRLALTAEGPLVLNGEAGYSVKSQAGQASHYYSQPHFAVTGTVLIEGAETTVTGHAWLDREWSSQPLTGDQTGWDWFSLRFDTGEKLMIYGLRHQDGSRYATGTWIMPDGTAQIVPPDATQMEPLRTHKTANRTVPIAWHLALPDRALDIEVRALNPDSYMATQFPYWEGPVTVRGSHTGLGYLEMTGH